MMLRHDLKTGLLPLLTLLTLLAACGEPTSDEPIDNTPAQTDDEFPPLENLQTLIGDHPESKGKVLARYDEKFDVALPAKYDLVATQSPVRNQQSRGVCSIFSTVGLMESLYIKAGMAMPDFSEQYLQWSVKFQIGSFPNTSGSSASSNLDAVVRYGIPEEKIWPYEGREWSGSNDMACGASDEENRPTHCFTNGEATDEMRSAELFKLPKRDYVSSNDKSIRTYMFQNKRPVVIGASFYYQSWSHGGSKLRINQQNKLAGAVVYPSTEDQTDSEARPAGHSILLVGWDDNLEFPRLDAEGEPMRDDAGNIVYDKGFFLFKNSWGATGTWGSQNPFGTGYGWISYRYVREWGRAVSATEPKLEPKVEICGDDIDNDNNGLSDCQDSACSATMACKPDATTEIYGSMNGALEIPDNDPSGVSDAIDVDAAGNIGLLKVTVDIEHSWSGDVRIELVHPNGDRAVVLEAAQIDDANVNQTFVVDDFNNLPAAGEWTLVVIDAAPRDTGKLNGWQLEITAGN